MKRTTEKQREKIINDAMFELKKSGVNCHHLEGRWWVFNFPCIGFCEAEVGFAHNSTSGVSAVAKKGVR